MPVRSASEGFQRRRLLAEYSRLAAKLGRRFDMRSFSSSLATLAILVLGCSAPTEDGALIGTIERDRLELVAEAREAIVELAVKEGQVVAAGDLVLRLDDERARVALAAEVARRDQAGARLAELVRGPRAEEIRQAHARLEGATSELETARLDRDRVASLVNSGVTSRQSLDHAENTVAAASSRRDQTSWALRQLETGVTSEELAQARDALSAAEASVQAAGIPLERLTIHAPVAAAIEALPYELGERPPVGAVVAVLLANARTYARVFVPETVRARVHPGVRARVRPDGLAKDFEGVVRVVASDPDFTPYFALNEHDRGRLSYLAEIDLVGDDARALPAGLPVSVWLELEPSPGSAEGR